MSKIIGNTVGTTMNPEKIGGGGGDAPVTSVNNKTGDVQLSAEDVGALPDSTKIPTKVSELENDRKYLTSVPAEYITETELNSKGYIKNAELETAVDDALMEAKESGIFDGEDGYTPQRETDYWTEADKNEIKAYVDEAILNGEW